MQVIGVTLIWTTDTSSIEHDGEMGVKGGKKEVDLCSFVMRVVNPERSSVVERRSATGTMG